MCFQQSIQLNHCKFCYCLFCFLFRFGQDILQLCVYSYGYDFQNFYVEDSSFLLLACIHNITSLNLNLTRFMTHSWCKCLLILSLQFNQRIE